MGSDGVRRHASRRDGAVVCVVCAAIVIALWSGCGGEGDAPPPAPPVERQTPVDALAVLSAAGLYEAEPAHALHAAGDTRGWLGSSRRSSLPATADGVVRLDDGDGRWIEILAVGRAAVAGAGTSQKLFPHCITCSREQGLAIARQRRGQ